MKERGQNIFQSILLTLSKADTAIIRLDFTKLLLQKEARVEGYNVTEPVTTTHVRMCSSNVLTGGGSRVSGDRGEISAAVGDRYPDTAFHIKCFNSDKQ